MTRRQTRQRQLIKDVNRSQDVFDDKQIKFVWLRDSILEVQTGYILIRFKNKLIKNVTVMQSFLPIFYLYVIGLWDSCCSIFSLLWSVLEIIVFPSSFGQYIEIHFKSVTWLVIKTVVGTYQSVLKRSHDFADYSDGWLTGDEWRVIWAYPVVVYRRCNSTKTYINKT